MEVQTKKKKSFMDKIKRKLKKQNSKKEANRNTMTTIQSQMELLDNTKTDIATEIYQNEQQFLQIKHPKAKKKKKKK